MVITEDNIGQLYWTTAGNIVEITGRAKSPVYYPMFWGAKRNDVNEFIGHITFDEIGLIGSDWKELQRARNRDGGKRYESLNYTHPITD